MVGCMSFASAPLRSRSTKPRMISSGARKASTITSPSQREKVGLFRRLKSRPKKEHVSSGIQDIASYKRNKRLYVSDWQNVSVHCIDPVRKEVIRSWGVESGAPWGISVT